MAEVFAQNFFINLLFGAQLHVCCTKFMAKTETKTHNTINIVQPTVKTTTAIAEKQVLRESSQQASEMLQPANKHDQN